MPFLFFLIFFFQSQSAAALDAESPAIAVEYARVQQNILATLLITPPAGFYAYAHKSPEGKPVTLQIRDNGTAAEIVYALGTWQKLESGKAAPVHTKSFPIWIRFPADAAGREVIAELSLLLCSAQKCIPVQQEIRLMLPVNPPDSFPLAKEYAQAAQAAEKAAPFAERIQADTHEVWASLHADSEEYSIWQAAASGFCAGLLLNLMPCVLPVLAFKFSALLAASQSRKIVREYAIFFSAGILCWFLVLACCVSGLKLAWGELFQSIWLVYALLILVFLLALSLFDLFTLPVLDVRISSSSPKLQAYTAGLCATLLATPCSGPLLGGVLAWAALQPLSSVLTVFLAAGLGMALPHLCLAAFPDRIFLPKTGAWQGILEKIAGFLLLGTSLYLYSILPAWLHIPALTVLLILAFCGWLWKCTAHASQCRRLLFRCLALLFSTSAIIWSVQLPQNSDSLWQAFTTARFESLAGKQPLLVEFTADWCPTCKVMEKTVLSYANLLPLSRKYRLSLLRADLTRSNPDAERLLRALGSISLPLTAFFPVGNASKPRILRDIYTFAQLEKAVQETTKE